MNKRKKMIRIITYVVIATFLLVILLPVIYTLKANSASPSINELRDNYAKAQRASEKAAEDYKKQQEQVKATSDQLDRIKEELLNAETEYNKIEALCNETELILSEKQAELVQAQTDAANYSDLFKKRIRILYERGPSSYLEILLGSSTFSDFLSRVEMVKRVSEHDNAILKQMAEVQRVISGAKTELELKLQEQEITLKEQSARKSEVEARRANFALSLSNLKKDAEEMKKFEDKMDADEELAARQLKEAIKKQEAAAKPSESAPKYSGGKFLWPVPSASQSSITSNFGMRKHPIYGVNKMHTGVDISAPNGVSVVSAENGIVFEAAYNSGYGNYVVVDHGGGIKTLYAHLSAFSVSKGQEVTRGTQVGKVGTTGASTGPHLHFEVIVNGAQTDPLKY